MQHWILRRKDDILMPHRQCQRGGGEMLLLRGVLSLPGAICSRRERLLQQRLLRAHVWVERLQGYGFR